MEPVPGTAFAVAYLPVPATVYGPAVGSLVTGIAAVLVGLFVACLGLGTGSAVAAGAFTITTSLLGGAALVVGVLAMRQIKASAGRFSGRGMAITGIVCGATGLGIGLLGLLLAVAVQ